MDRTLTDYRSRYEDADDGIRFLPGAEFKYGDLPGIPDGIAGDKLLRNLTKTDYFKGPLPESKIVEPEFSVDELNDIVLYAAWDLWDQLSLRASEGSSGLIPRQEYEALAFANSFYRWPEFFMDMTSRIGLEGAVNLGRTGRVPGSKVNMLHSWNMGSSIATLGRALLLIMDQIKTDDYLQEFNAWLKFGQALMWGFRGDGYIWASQNRYVTRALDDPWPERLRGSMKDLGADDLAAFKALMAGAELLSFYMHMDNRLGMEDQGPWISESGDPMIVRSIFPREDIYPWSMFAEDLPYSMVFVFELDNSKIHLEELRVISIGTLMTRPRNYLEGIARGSVWVRDEWDSEPREIPLDEAVTLYSDRIAEASFSLQEWMVKSPRRMLIESGSYTYYVGMLFPFLRAAGLYDEYCERLDFWEFDQRVANIYYELQRNQFARVVVPQKLFSATIESFAPVPDGAGIWRSKYFQT
jgi:hypothetical protein